MGKNFTVILFYKYVNIDSPKSLMEQQRKLCSSLGLKGRIIIAEEGINGTLEGTTENIEKYCADIKKLSIFKDIHIKHSVGTGKSFPKLSIKVRDEIVTSGLGTLKNVDNRITGKYLKPEELKAWIDSGREFYIVDMRNDYEQISGHFEGSILTNIKHFRDLPKFLPKINHLKDKEILTVCTGGVRCEKASGYLIENGFENVYQLEGGIHTYMERYPSEDFKGKLYVFDGRVLIGFNTKDKKHEIVSKCEKCNKASERYINCENSYCHRHFIMCGDCDIKNGAYCNFRCKLLKKLAPKITLFQ